MSYKYADTLAQRRRDDLRTARWRFIYRPVLLFGIGALIYYAFNSCVPVAVAN